MSVTNRRSGWELDFFGPSSLRFAGRQLIAGVQQHPGYASFSEDFSLTSGTGAKLQQSPDSRPYTFLVAVSKQVSLRPIEHGPRRRSGGHIPLSFCVHEIACQPEPCSLPVSNVDKISRNHIRNRVRDFSIDKPAHKQRERQGIFGVHLYITGPDFHGLVPRRQSNQPANHSLVINHF